MPLRPSALGLLVILHLGASAGIANAQTPAVPRPDSLLNLNVHATRTTAPITINGILDEPAWQSAPVITNLVQSDQHEGEAATERTEVRVLYDDDALYVGAWMYDSHPDSIVARMCRRDDSIASDRFMFFVDPLHDRRSGYYFSVSASGVLTDGTLFNDSWDDNSWDGVWQAKVHRDKQGWTAELRIPFSQMRFRHDARTVWGINFRREIARRTERDWLWYPRKLESGFVSRFPDLVGLADIHPRSSIELTPYATGKAEYLASDTADPFKTSNKYTPSGGADLRMSVGSNMTLNATVNPDFGQVEVDPAVVNLSDVESFFQEKRPFFVENSRVFNFGNEGANDYWGFNWPDPLFFYGRRIGRAPEIDLSNVDFADLPVATHILGAAKLTGQLAPGFNFGTLHALTARETGRLDEGGLLSNDEVEPLTYYGIARGLKDFPGHRLGIGAITSFVNRRFDGGVLHDELDRTALVSGFDGWYFLDKKQVWVLSGYTAMSNVTGTPTRMIALQENSRHYFQRPDESYATLDSSATSMTGWVSRWWVNKQSGKHFIFNSAIGAINPKFDNDDIGFMSRTDIINGHLGMGWNWQDSNHWRKWANVLASLFESRDFGGVVTHEGLWTSVQAAFMNNYYTRQNFAIDPETYSDTQTRGGPRMLNPASYNGNGHFETDSNHRLYWYTDWSWYHDQGGTWDGSWNPGVEIKPISNLLVSIGPGFERTTQMAQYVQTQPDPVVTSTYGNRYVFARLDQTTLSANLRLNWSFTPNLSLQTFIQPLLSAGNYTDFKELARPRSFDFVHYGAAYDPASGLVTPADGGTPFSISNPDFNFRSLRGNAVLRWEYAPGSTLYFVWTQERNQSDGNGDFEFGHSFDQLTQAHPSNIFIVKATYYLSR